MDIFEYAVKMEKDGEMFYRDMAYQSSNLGLKKILNNLADDELKHREAIEVMKEAYPVMVESDVLNEAKNIFEQMKDDKDFLITDDSKLEASIQSEEAELTQIRLYEQAKDIEQQSIDFYQDLAVNAEDEEKKSIFMQLVEEEKKHYFLIDNMINFIKSPKIWLDNAEFNNLEEY